MPYVERIVKAGDVIEHKKMFTARVHPKGATRAENKNKTKEAMKKVNDRKAEEQLRWLLNANFRRGDYHLVLHYYDKGVTLEQAEKDKKDFLRLCRKEYRKRELEWKYVACTETKRMTNVHHHIIIKPMDVEVLQSIWERVLGGRSGHLSVMPLDRRGNHGKLARYLLKETESTMRRYRESETRGKRFSTSKRLIRPKPYYHIVQAKSWTKDPRPRKGYRLLKDEDGETVRFGVHDLTGWPWMEYFEIRASL